MPCLRSDDLSISCASVAADSGGKNNETSEGAFNARSRHVQRERLTAAQAKPRRGGDRSGALVARDAKGYVSSPSPSSERRDCDSPLLARQFRSPAFKGTFCYSRGADHHKTAAPIRQPIGLPARPVASHSITSSASASSLSGTARPSAFAVLRLITSSNFVGGWIGKSPGFSPFSTLATYEPGSRYIAYRNLDHMRSARRRAPLEESHI